MGPVGRCTGNEASAHGPRSLEWQREQADGRPKTRRCRAEQKRGAKCRPKGSDSGMRVDGAAPADREILDLFPVPCECLHALPRSPIPHTNLHAPITSSTLQTRALSGYTLRKHQFMFMICSLKCLLGSSLV